MAVVLMPTDPTSDAAVIKALAGKHAETTALREALPA